MKLAQSKFRKLAWLAISSAAGILVVVGVYKISAPNAAKNTGTLGQNPGVTPELQRPSLETTATSTNEPVADRMAMSFPPATYAVKLAAKLDKIEGQADPAYQASELRKLVSEVPISGISIALEVAKDRATAFHTDYRLMLVSRWAEHEPSSAASWVERNIAGAERLGALNATAAAWARRDLPAAVEWAQQLPQLDEVHTGVLAAAYEAAAGLDPSAALTLVEQLPASESRDDFVMHAAATWAAKAPEKALEWARGLADEELREKTTATIAGEWSERDPGAAATLAVQSLPPGKAQDDAVVGIVQRWVQKEPEQAAAWVNAFPDSRLRATALEAVVKLWADSDVTKAGNWVNSISSGTGGDVAVGAYVEKVAVQHPEIAAQWAVQIRDDLLREQQMENLGELWLSNDPVAARAWISQSGLADATKSRLLASQSN